MHSFNQPLSSLYKKGLISKEAVFAFCDKRDEMGLVLKGISSMDTMH
jgi:hypothetical protein